MSFICAVSYNVVRVLGCSFVFVMFHPYHAITLWYMYMLCHLNLGRSVSSPRPPRSGMPKEVNLSRNTIQEQQPGKKMISFDSPIRQLPMSELQQLMRTKQKEIADLENSVSQLMDKSNASLGNYKCLFVYACIKSM